MKPVVINKVAEEWGSLGNMSKHEILFEGLIYPRSEHLFQCLRLSDPALREEIRDISNPMKAKMRSKKIFKEHPEAISVTPLSMEDIENMKFVLKLKLEQHEDVQGLLMLTGDREIVEDCTKRQRGSGLFWGAAKQEDGSWKGENWLGVLWMKVREEFLEE